MELLDVQPAKNWKAVFLRSSVGTASAMAGATLTCLFQSWETIPVGWMLAAFVIPFIVWHALAAEKIWFTSERSHIWPDICVFSLYLFPACVLFASIVWGGESYIMDIVEFISIVLTGAVLAPFATRGALGYWEVAPGVLKCEV